MINNYRIALKVLSFTLVAGAALRVLIAGSTEDMKWDKAGHLDSPSYTDTLTKGLDCDTEGALPEVAIVTYKDKVTAIRVSDPHRLDIAFGDDRGLNVAALQ